MTDDQTIRASVALWAAAANEADRFDLAAALYDQLPTDGPDPVGYARALLLAGRPADALAVLDRHGVRELPAKPSDSFPAQVLAACRAAIGDEPAYRWLYAAAGGLRNRPVAYLLAAAAYGRDDHTADTAWMVLGRTHKVHTPAVISRHGTAFTARRGRQDPRKALVRVAVAAFAFDRLDPPVDHEPAPVLAAAAELRRRGDTAGARLLLHTVAARLPSTPALDAAEAQLAPAVATRRYRTAVRVWRWLWPISVLLGLVVGHNSPMIMASLMVFVIGVVSLAPSMPLPGLGRVDSRVWRGVRALRDNPNIGAGDSKPLVLVCRYAPVASGVAVAFLSLRPCVSLSLAVARLAGGLSPGAVASIAILPTAGLLGATYAGIGTLLATLNRRRHARNRAQALHDRLAAAGTCQCAATRSHAGFFAAAYRERHLVPVPGAAPVPGGRLASCPTTGYLWLSVPSGALLRGEPR